MPDLGHLTMLLPKHMFLTMIMKLYLVITIKTKKKPLHLTPHFKYWYKRVLKVTHDMEKETWYGNENSNHLNNHLGMKLVVPTKWKAIQQLSLFVLCKIRHYKHDWFKSPSCGHVITCVSFCMHYHGTK